MQAPTEQPAAREVEAVGEALCRQLPEMRAIAARVLRRYPELRSSFDEDDAAQSTALKLLRAARHGRIDAVEAGFAGLCRRSVVRRVIIGQHRHPSAGRLRAH